MRAFFEFHDVAGRTVKASTEDREVFALVIGMCEHLGDASTNGWTPDLEAVHPAERGTGRRDLRFTRVNLSKIVSVEWWAES